MSRYRNIRWLIPAFAVVGLTWTYSGLAQDPGSGKTAGQKVDSVFQDIKGGFRKAGNAVKGEFSKAKTAVNNMGVESRVYGRIHWDKDLYDEAIELDATEDGILTLEGSVGTAKAKDRAVELAKGTVGVTKVVDKLAVKPSPRVTPAN